MDGCLVDFNHILNKNYNKKMIYKEELNSNKAALELLLRENGDKTIDYKSQLSVIEQKLENLNKPEATPMFLDKIYETILEGLENVDLDGDLDCDFEIDYHNTVVMENVSFKNPEEIATEIYKEIKKLFSEAECPEE